MARDKAIENARALTHGHDPRGGSTEIPTFAKAAEIVIGNHVRALPYHEVSAALDAVNQSSSGPVTKLAFHFLVLTAARSGEVRGATWDEIDLDNATWAVPAERMKSRREHRVPLSGRALEVLSEAEKLSGNTGGACQPNQVPKQQVDQVTVRGSILSLPRF